MSSTIQHKRSFLEQYLNGEVLSEDIDDFVDSWHENPSGIEIYEFLGMSREEYSLWLGNPETLPQIARARRTGVPLDVALRAALEDIPIAARSADAIRVKRLMRWLARTGKIR